MVPKLNLAIRNKKYSNKYMLRKYRYLSVSKLINSLFISIIIIFLNCVLVNSLNPIINNNINRTSNYNSDSNNIEKLLLKKSFMKDIIKKDKQSSINSEYNNDNDKFMSKNNEIVKKVKNLDNLDITNIEVNSESENLIKNSNKLRILYLSDIHLDLLYDSKAETLPYECKFRKEKNNNYNYNEEEDLSNLSNLQDFEYETNINLDENDFGKKFCDTNKNLFNLLLDKAKSLNIEFDYVIILGDNVNHTLNFDQINIKKNYEDVFRYIRTAVEERFSSSDVLFCLGNNDFVERYDFPNTMEDYNSQIKKIESQLLRINNHTIEDSDKSNSTSDDIRIDSSHSYSNSWYSYKLNNQVIAVMLNSVLFNKKMSFGKYSPQHLSDLSDLIEKQFLFLEITLKQALERKQKTLIHFHIPMNNFYDIVNSNLVLNDIMDKYLIRFDEICFKYRDAILKIITGHLHFSALSVRNSSLNASSLLYSSAANAFRDNNNDKSINDANAMNKKTRNNRYKSKVSIFNSNKIKQLRTEVDSYNNYYKNNDNKNSNLYSDLSTTYYYASGLTIPGITPYDSANPGFSVLEINSSENNNNNVETVDNSTSNTNNTSNTEIISITNYYLDLFSQENEKINIQEKKGIIQTIISLFTSYDNDYLAKIEKNHYYESHTEALTNHFYSFNLKEELELSDFTNESFYKSLLKIINDEHIQINFLRYISGYVNLFDLDKLVELLQLNYNEEGALKVLKEDRIKMLVCSGLSFTESQKKICIEKINKNLLK